MLAKLNDEEQSQALQEFVEPVATLCLLAPDRFRLRFICAAAHLCHLVNRVRETEWPEKSLPVDDEIYLDSASVQGGLWHRYSRLQTRIETIGGKAIRAATADFRNAFSHRYSARGPVG